MNWFNKLFYDGVCNDRDFVGWIKRLSEKTYHENMKHYSNAWKEELNEEVGKLKEEWCISLEVVKNELRKTREDVDLGVSKLNVEFNKELRKIREDWNMEKLNADNTHYLDASIESKSQLLEDRSHTHAVTLIELIDKRIADFEKRQSVNYAAMVDLVVAIKQPKLED